MNCRAEVAYGGQTPLVRVRKRKPAERTTKRDHLGLCNMYTCSGNCIQERSAGFPMFSLITLLTLISLIVLQPRSYIKAR